jgi:hypothetical protein
MLGLSQNKPTKIQIQAKFYVFNSNFGFFWISTIVATLFWFSLFKDDTNETDLLVDEFNGVFDFDELGTLSLLRHLPLCYNVFKYYPDVTKLESGNMWNEYQQNTKHQPAAHWKYSMQNQTEGKKTLSFSHLNHPLDIANFITMVRSNQS